MADTAAAQRTFTSLTVFGDSFSDVGNARALTGGAQPFRYTNQNVIWADVLAGLIGRTADVNPVFLPASVNAQISQPTPAAGVYAVGGALTTGATGTGTQIGLWCGINATSSVCTRVGSATGLYVLAGGGNDVKATATNVSLTLVQQQAAVLAAANNVTNQAALLASHGAGNVLLNYLPDLGQFPVIAQAGVQGLPALTTSLTDLFNNTLAAGISGLRATFGATNFFDFRLDYLFSNALARPQQYGFTNTTQPCTTNGTQGIPCAGDLFWDGTHVTTSSHTQIGQAAYQLVAYNVNVAVVPEPTTWALVASGLVGLGVVRRKRRV